MEFIKTPIQDAQLIKPRVFGDDRGYFMRAWCAEAFANAGITEQFVQANMSGSQARGTLRGLHYQTAPHEEGKLIRCLRGSIFDVVVDIRKDSPSYGQWYGATLSADNREMLYVPPGCAHAYQTLEADSEVYYLVTAFYAPESERGICWNDPAFNIDWPVKDTPILSDKDLEWPAFKL